MKAFSMYSLPVPLEKHRLSRGDSPDPAAQIQAVLPGYAQLPASEVGGDHLLIQERLPLIPTRRLVVLVPPGEFHETALARRVWQLAANSCFFVLYLALSPDTAQADRQRRRLANLAASTSGENVHAHASLCAQVSWRQALEKTLHPGDLLVCLASHYVSEHLLWRRRLGEQLVQAMGAPVYMIGGIKIGMVPEVRQAINEALAWTASLCLIALFFGLQIGIDRSTSGLLSTILLSLLIVVEMYLLFKINQWI